MRGRDIKRYGYNWANLWLINTHNGVRGKFPPIDINEYPAVKAHLDHYWEQIRDRADQGNTPYNLRNCAYLEDFLKPKIVYQELTQGSSFALDKNGEYLVSNTGYIISGNNLDYILYMLNSKVIEYCFKCFYSISLGESGLRWLSQYVMNLPIPQISDSLKETLMSSLHDCTTIPQHSIMREDELSICKIYGFSREEITQILNY